MAKAFDLTNQRFGRLIALYKCDYKINNHYPWFCQCDCGNTKVVRTQDLVSGKTTSCGCLQREKASEVGKKTGPINGPKRFQKKDITNQRFGKLVALSPTDLKQSHSTKWLCQCDCGNQTIVAINDLTSGNTSSCGCLKSKGEQKISQLLLEYNISFVTEKSFDGFNYSKTCGKPKFDFFVNNQYLIEYDGIQHFQNNNFFNISLEEQQARDLEKNKWCKDQGIPLIRIPYTHLNKIKIQDLLLETSEFIINI